MTQHYATVILAAAVALAPTVPTSGQDRRADASRSAALRLRPDTLATFINNLAGLQVRLVGGVVDEIASPRVFILKNERGGRYPFQPSKVAIVVDTGSAFIRERAPVFVTGIARTPLGAEMDANLPLRSLNENERKVVAKLPLVVTSSVETPDGVQLVRLHP